MVRLLGLTALAVLLAACDAGAPPAEPAPVLDIAWSARHGAFSDAPPAASPGAAAGGVVYDAGGRDLQALDAATGDVLWRAPIDDNIEYIGLALLADDRGAYGVHYDHDRNNRNTLFAWDAADGSLRWSVVTETGSEYGLSSLSGLALVDETLLVPFWATARDGTPPFLRAYDTADGSVRWTTTLATAPSSTVFFAASEGRLIVHQPGERAPGVGFARLTALDPATGAALWTRDVEGPQAAPPASDGGLLVFTSRRTGTTAVEASTGAVRWRAPGSAERAVLDGDRVYVGDGRGMTAFDRQTGAEAWSVSYGEGTNTHTRTPLLFGGYVVNPTRAGLMVHDPATGAILAAERSADGTDFLNGSLGHGRLYAQTTGAVYAIDAIRPRPVP